MKDESLYMFLYLFVGIIIIFVIFAWGYGGYSFYKAEQNDKICQNLLGQEEASYNIIESGFFNCCYLETTLEYDFYTRKQICKGFKE